MSAKSQERLLLFVWLTPGMSRAESGSVADAVGRRLDAVVRLGALRELRVGASSTSPPFLFPRMHAPRTSQLPYNTLLDHLVCLEEERRGNGGLRAFAVLRLSTSSNCLGRSTGRSAGLSPLRSLST